MELAQNQIDFYNDNGYLAVENVFSESEIDDLRRVTDEFVEQARELTEHTPVFDLDFEAGHSAQTPKLRRITGPHKLHPVYDATMNNSNVLDVLERLIGPDIRLHHTKLNMKAPGGGAQVEWHTDWGFYPHTNDDVLEVGVSLDDMEIANGCLMVIPGSHRGPAYDHYEDGVFVGAVSLSEFSMDQGRAHHSEGREHFPAPCEDPSRLRAERVRPAPASSAHGVCGGRRVPAERLWRLGIVEQSHGPWARHAGAKAGTGTSSYSRTQACRGRYAL